MISWVLKSDGRLKSRLLCLRIRDLLCSKPRMLGVFRSGKRAYQVKVAEESLRKELTKFNGKFVTLGGKIRNNGKYLIVQEILSRAGGLAPSSNSSPARM